MGEPHPAVQPSLSDEGTLAGGTKASSSSCAPYPVLLLAQKGPQPRSVESEGIQTIALGPTQGVAGSSWHCVLEPLFASPLLAV